MSMYVLCLVYRVGHCVLFGGVQVDWVMAGTISRAESERGRLHVRFTHSNIGQVSD